MPAMTTDVFSSLPAVSPTALSSRTQSVDCAPYYKDAMLSRFYAICNCGCVCVAHCPQEAITLVREPTKGEPLEIQNLIVEATKICQD